MRLYFGLILSLCLIILSIPQIILMTTKMQSYALMQVAGGVIVEIKPGHSEPFTWGLISDKKNQTTTVKLSADGRGAEFLSFPKVITLSPGNLTELKGKVTIPKDYPVGIKLSPIMRATEVSQGNQSSGMTIKVQMAKTLSIFITQNATQSSGNRNQTLPT